MKHLAAYMLLVLSGNAEPSKADVEKLLKEAGVKSDAKNIETMINSLKGKQIHEIAAEGAKKLVSGGSGGGAPAAAGSAPAAAKEDKKKEEEDEDADVDCADLFGDEY